MDNIKLQTEKWLDEFVVTHDICPFAAPVINRQQLSITVSDKQAYEDVYQAMLEYIQDFLTAEDSSETAIYVCPLGFDEFENLLELHAELSAALASVELDSIIQLIAFHPDYCFEGEDANDPANYTNRSPYPMLHILRQESINRLNIDSEKLAQIPQTNIELLRGFDEQKIQRLKRLVSTD